MPVTHPSTLVTSDQLTTIRNALETDAYRRDIYVHSIKAHADDWSTRSVRIPARAGYYHDFTCMDGTRLSWPESLRHVEPIPKNQSYRCSECGKTYQGEKFDTAVRCLQHNDLMIAARDLAFVGALENKPDYLKKAAQILIAYAEAYPGRHTGPTTGGILYQSLDEAVHFIYLAQAYDLLVGNGILSADEQTHICHDLLWECAEGLIKCGLGGNWGSWHLSAVGVIGFATDQQHFIDYGITNFKKQIQEQLGSDGLWPESVHTYHFYPMRGFLQLVEAALPSGIDLYHWTGGPGKSLAAMFTQPVSYSYPNMQLPAINDGWFQSYLPLDVYEVGYDRLRLPELGRVVDQCRRLNTREKTGSPDNIDIWSVIHGIKMEGRLPKPALESKNFANIGICTLRLGLEPQKETMLTFDYGRFLGHGQFDKMGITLFNCGRLLMADYGTPSYGSAILPFYKGTASHNTIMIDGKNQLPTKSGKFLTFVDLPELKVAAAETAEVAHGVNWRRAVLLTTGVVVVVDELRSDSQHQYDSIIHCAADRFVPADSIDMQPITSESLGIANFTGVTTADSVLREFAGKWLTGNRVELSMACASDNGAQYYIAVCPAENANHQIPVIVQRVSATSVTMVSVFSLEPEKPASVSLKDGLITVSGLERYFELRLNDDKLYFTMDEGKPQPTKLTFPLKAQ